MKHLKDEINKGAMLQVGAFIFFIGFLVTIIFYDGEGAVMFAALFIACLLGLYSMGWFNNNLKN